MPDSPHPVVLIGALTTGSDRGLVADVLAAHSLGLSPLPVCTQITAASAGRVTDVTDVPSDTVRAQLEHLATIGRAAGMKVGVLAGAATAEAVLDAAEAMDGPVVLDLVASGPSGETVLSADGIDAVAARLGVADLVTISRQDAELVTGGSVESLDDAQVAAQRLSARGARAVVIRCGALPYRFYDPADDPGAADAQPLSFDLYYDGDDFALFEAPRLDADASGASSVLTMAALAGLIARQPIEESLQAAKRAATDSVRFSVDGGAFGRRIAYPST